MSSELISIVVLVAVVLVATTTMGINMGVLGVVAASVVDSSPFSTSGALTVANTPEAHRERVFKRLMQWGMSMVVVAPPIAWLVFVVPGWL